MVNNSDCGNSGKQITGVFITPKDEVLDYDLDEFNFSRNLEGNAASSSSSKIKLHLLGMGFPPALVDRAIDEKGEDNAELLVETILAYSAPSKSDSLDSIDDFSMDDKHTCSPTSYRKEPMKEEQGGVLDGASEKKMTLLRMNFSKHDVESALEKHGEDAHIPDLVDFILAAQIADNHDRGADNHDKGANCDAVLIDLEKGQRLTTEELFGTMEKTLKLLSIGFTEQEVSTAIEKYGSDLPVSELAASIVAEQCGEKYVPPFLRRISSSTRGNHSIDPLIVKKEEYDVDDGTSTRNLNGMESVNGKRPVVDQGINEAGNLKRPKQELEEELNDSLNPVWLDGRHGNNFADVEFKPEELDMYGMENLFMPAESNRNLSKTAAKPPYFFVGFLTPLPHATWVKISNFLFSIEPEFSNTEGFSALSRHESYIHNLPMENRFHIQPEPPLTIEEAIPNFRKLKPSWDTRKKLSCVNSDVMGPSQLCEKLKKLLENSNGHLSTKQKDDFLNQCQIANLRWISNHELAPIEPDVLEKILGYPPNYTRLASSLTERLQLLSDCFQIDTLAYHLSVLKPRFPHGLNMISVYSGLGAAEIALHRLGIRMRLVVSVEPSEAKRKTLKRWWESQRMSGDLVQIESIKRLTSAKLEELRKKYGPINFVFCQNPSSNSSKSSSTSGSKPHGGVDYPMFYEFSRVLQAVRRMLARKKR